MVPIPYPNIWVSRGKDTAINLNKVSVFQKGRDYAVLLIEGNWIDIKDEADIKDLATLMQSRVDAGAMGDVHYST